MPLYDYMCENCETIKEVVTCIDKTKETIFCGSCGAKMKRILSTFKIEKFPEGLWDIGNNSIEIRSRNQLREVMKRHNDNPDSTKHSQAKYLDGYSSY